MAKKLGKFLAFAAVAGAAAAGTYYYLQNRKAKEEREMDDFPDPSSEDAFDDDGLDENDYDDDDFEDESEPTESHIFSKATSEHGHTYVTLDLKAAQEKAATLRDNVTAKAEETVSKIKSNNEYKAVSEKITETVSKLKNNEKLQSVDSHLENAIHKVKEATEKAIDSVSGKLEKGTGQDPEDLQATDVPTEAMEAAEGAAAPDPVEAAEGAAAPAAEEEPAACPEAADAAGETAGPAENAADAAAEAAAAEEAGAVPEEPKPDSAF